MNIYISHLNSDILSNIIEFLDKKSIKNFYYTFREFRYTKDERIEKLFLEKIRYTIKSKEQIKEIKKYKLNIKYFRLHDDFTEPLGDILKGLNITLFDLGNKYNESLQYTVLENNINIVKNCLEGLPIKGIGLGINYDQPLNNSLEGLPITNLYLGLSYDKPLHYTIEVKGESIEKSCLEGLPINKLTLGQKFNQPLDIVFKNCCENLNELILGDIWEGKFNQPLNGTFHNCCRNLTNLDLCEYNQPLYYTVIENNKSIVKSCLEGLKLKILHLGIKYNKPLYYTIIENNRSIEKSCLEGLPLDILILSDKYNLSLKSCLKGLPLKEIVFRHSFNKELYFLENSIVKSSLEGLPLDMIYFGYGYNKPMNYTTIENNIPVIKNCLDGLPIKEIYINDKYKYKDQIDKSIKISES